MRIAGKYSFNGGLEILEDKYPELLQELYGVIEKINTESCRLKLPKYKELTKAQRAGVGMYYSPIHLNALFDYYLFKLGWELKPRINTNDSSRNGSREMDFVKEDVGLEIQFGKYSFLTYDIVAKMIIFKKFGVINYGIEVCPMASMLSNMNSGIGAFEQVKWDLVNRGFVKGFDVPVLVLGVENEATPLSRDHQLELLDENDAVGTVVRNRFRELPEHDLRMAKQTGIVD